METSKWERKHLKKSVLAAALLIGASTMLFQGLTQAATTAEYNKTNTVSTSYNYKNQSSKAVQINLPKDCKKATYTVTNIDLEYYKNQTPTKKDMTKEDAAEIGAQALRSIYGLNLNGQVIEMGYLQANDSIPRSRWYADVLINGKRCYSFEVDSVTGDLFSVCHSRTLDKNVSVAFDAALAKNPQEYTALAKKTAEKLNVVHGAVASAEYNGQGYANNDPTITINIKGKNGEVACIQFSRHDKALLAVSYNTEYQYTLKTLKKIEQETKDRATQRQKPAISASGSHSPSLENSIQLIPSK